MYKTFLIYFKTRNFNKVVAVDDFYLDEIRLVHFMRNVSGHSACHICNSANKKDATFGLQACWMSQFCHPQQVHGEPAFNTAEFISFISEIVIKFRPVPNRRQSANPIKHKNGVIRSIYIPMKSSNENKNCGLLEMHAEQIRNGMYGKDTMSAFQFGKALQKTHSFRQ